MPPRYLLPLLVLGLALLLPAAASASSIAYVKDNNVWLSSPDGSRQQQVTFDGTAAKYYNSPSQADDGTILAKHGSHFVRLRPDGTRIGEPVPGLGSDYSHSGNVFVMSGPNDPRISPDGKRFTYWISVRGDGHVPDLGPAAAPTRTPTTRSSATSTASRSRRSSASCATTATRRGSTTATCSSSTTASASRRARSRPSAQGEGGLLQWFDAPGGVHQIGQGQVTRQGDKLVTLAGSADFGPAQEHLWLYGVTSYPAEPLSACYIREAAPPSGKFLVPSWSPDGNEVAVTESDGIHIYGNIPDLRVADPDCGAITERVLVHGAKPAWGRRTCRAAAGPAPPPGPGGGAQAGRGARRRERQAAPARPRRAGAGGRADGGRRRAREAGRRGSRPLRTARPR